MDFSSCIRCLRDGMDTAAAAAAEVGAAEGEAATARANEVPLLLLPESFLWKNLFILAISASADIRNHHLNLLQSQQPELIDSRQRVLIVDPETMPHYSRSMTDLWLWIGT